MQAFFIACFLRFMPYVASHSSIPPIIRTMVIHYLKVQVSDTTKQKAALQPTTKYSQFLRPVRNFDK